MKPYRCNRDRYFAWNGAILVLLGAILLLDRLGIVSASEVLRFWPVLLVAAGTVLLVEMTSLVGRTLGAVLAAGGLILQASNLGFLRVRGEVFWPLVLMGIGVVLLGRALEERNRPIPETPSERPDFARRFWDGAERFVKSIESVNGEHASVFSHVERRVTDQNLERMKVVAVFGAFEMDLRQAGIQGDQAVVEADAIFGGIEIVVPEDWLVVPRGAGVFGGFSDETRQPDSPSKRLIVTGAGVFGGVVITNTPGYWRRRHHRMHQKRKEWHDRRWEYKD
jgi:predicted membrane protein